MRSKKNFRDLQGKKVKSLVRSLPECPQNRTYQIPKENLESGNVGKQDLVQPGSRKDFYLRENESKIAKSIGTGIGDERMESKLIELHITNPKVLTSFRSLQDKKVFVN